MNNFWKELQKKAHQTGRPFTALAPMADVTDSVFRELVAGCSRHGEECGGPDVLWTEFVSADGLCSRGREKLLIDFKYNENHRPIVAQIFGAKPDHIFEAVKLCKELGFDGVDINMGCPDRTIEKQGAGACMMKTKGVALEVITAALRAANGEIPVSVKTRLGYSAIELEDWIKPILVSGISALTVHVRTRKDLSQPPAKWEYMSEIVALRDEHAPHVVLTGNGDVGSLKDAQEKFERYGCDGIMIGRAVFGNPWIFDWERSSEQGKELHLDVTEDLPRGYHHTDISHDEKIQTMIRHAHMFWDEYKGIKNFATMKKHIRAYVRGFPGASELRNALMQGADSPTDIERIVEEFKNSAKVEEN